jgi:hypothetical protein
MVNDDVGHVAETDGRAAGVLHDHLREVGRRGEGHPVLDPESLVGCLDDPAGARRGGLYEGQVRDELCVRARLDDLLQGHAVRAEPGGIDEHLQLPIALTPHGDVGHAGHPHQAGSDVPAGEKGHVDERKITRREPDHHHPAGR